MSRLAARSTAEEQMDAADLDPAVYARVLADLAQVNRVTLARRPTIDFIARAIGGRTRACILDVGFGQGDMLRGIADWGRRRRKALTLIGVDLNPGSAPAARAATLPDLAIDYRTGDYAELAEPIGIMVSSLVAHHMTRPQLIAFLRFMEDRAALGWMVNDLHRHRLAHFGFPLLARAMRWHRIVREDGTLSIARSFRPADWQELLAEAGIPSGAAHVVRRFPFRLCVERLR